MRLFVREYYLEQLRGFYHTDLIKVITGIRRCGKSCFLQTVKDDLMGKGVNASDIISVNLDRKGFLCIKRPDQLEALLDKMIGGAERKYIFIDEVQNVQDFEPLLNAYREEGHSIFITGSNSYLLSGELATKLTGRYIEIEMFPLNFSEYLGMKKFLGKAVTESPAVEFRHYLHDGGFPKALEFDNALDRRAYTEEVIAQIFKKDIRGRVKIKNVSVFEKIKTYIINNFGATTNVKSIANYLRKTEGLSIEPETIHRYIEILENAKLIYKCRRFDQKSKRSLRGEEKYYLADLSLYFAANADARMNFGPALENVLYCYLRSRRYAVSVGRIGKTECDFITSKADGYAYIQVAMSIENPETEEREYRPFGLIRDGYPRWLFTLDPLQQTRDGVRHVNIAEFLRDEQTV